MQSLEGAISGLQAAQADGLRRLNTGLAAAVDDAQATLEVCRQLAWDCSDGGVCRMQPQTDRQNMLYYVAMCTHRGCACTAAPAPLQAAVRDEAARSLDPLRRLPELVAAAMPVTPEVLGPDSSLVSAAGGR